MFSLSLQSLLLRVLPLGCLVFAASVQADWKALRALERDGALVSARVQDLQDTAIIHDLHAGTRRGPASITKLVVAAAALDTWPADKSFETRVLGAGPLKGGRLQGDLILHGDGDATLDHRDLWMLAGQIRAAGVLRVDGDVVAQPVFGPLGCDNVDRCEALSRSHTAYNVPITALGVDYGTWCVRVEPGAHGADARLSACGGIDLPVPVEGSIGTVAATAKSSFWVERRTEDGQDRIHVGGTIRQGQAQQVYRAMSDPALGAALLLRQMLVNLGVEVAGRARVRHDPPPESARLLARVEGLSLKEQIGRMLRHSNNYVADLLTLNIAAARGSGPPSQLAEASKVLSGFVQSRGAADADAPRIYSGSGLTPENRLSAAEMVAMLGAQYRDTETFPAFLGGMVVPRQAPYGFLRRGNAAWLDRVALKTGNMNDPRSVCAVAGYLRRSDGGWMAFAIMVNGSERLRRVPMYKAMEAIREDVQDLLARY